ncbi:hypothetical protein G3A_16220 [Bacillus sp. 17376]|uniref:Mobile element protein n=1 Tax=Mesobacillus boroniphilus JCM 21738 TaxID=1294265 RepID=W4RWG0_9BACI|nr:hypothetical protein G3A_16220 [Bacillus sp. 17376]GAE48218.1 mobile element protein [Mesobacillus boroniphilus JCM 21738]
MKLQANNYYEMHLINNDRTAEGCQGLKPKSKTVKQIKKAVPPHLLEEAILLRREVLGRSVSQIIQILEWDGKAQPGHLKRNTLQEKLAERGYSSTKCECIPALAQLAPSFQKRFGNSLWQSDIKYGPFLPIGPNRKNKQVYLVLFIDDATKVKV